MSSVPPLRPPVVEFSVVRIPISEHRKLVQHLEVHEKSNIHPSMDGTDDLQPIKKSPKFHSMDELHDISKKA